ncbi:MAG: LolA family protein [Planctomycetota bacterium]|jgi:outer membrane lipoprotein-sorting protein
MSKIMIKTACIVLCATGISWACGCTQAPQKQQQENQKDDPVNMVLEKLNKTTLSLKSYQSQIEYKFIQPVLDSETLQKGVFYYTRSDGKSSLNINFNTHKLDDEKEQKYVERWVILDGASLTHPDYEFKGIWLALLDYQIKEVKYYQLAEPNDPNKSTDVFELVSKKLPMLGFSRIEDLKKQFEVNLIEPQKAESEKFTQVHLKVKPNSIYKDDYFSIDFWIDKKLGLPAKIVAVKSTPNPPYRDIEEIKFLKPRVNKRIDKKVFELKIPKGFGEPEILPLERKKY